MQPVFCIIADGKDITSLINDRLLLLRTSDKPGMASDTLELQIDDRDSAVTLPPRGAELQVYLGYDADVLTRLGRYVVDEIDISGPPATMTLRGKASDMRGSGKTSRTGIWEDVPLQQIVRDIAARNGWVPQCPVLTRVPRIDQIDESDYNLITRVAQLYDCTAKVADGNLLVLPRQDGQSASGQALGVVTIRRSDTRRWKFHLKDRAAYKAVQSKHLDSKTGEQKAAVVSNPDAPEGLETVFTDRHIYPSKSVAEQAAKARLAEFNRSTASLYLEMAGRTDLFAERLIDAQGFKPGLDGEYLIEEVRQTFTATGWDTTVQCNGGKQGKAAAKGEKAKQATPLKVD